MLQYNVMTQSDLTGDKQYPFVRYDDAIDAYRKFEALESVYAASLHGRNAAGEWLCLESFRR
jgi:hypothetical protein